MTIALVYRSGDEAFFLHDLRITHRNRTQVDAMMKFATFDARLGMFFAGDVSAFKRLIPHIRAVAHSITIDNVLNANGPLATTVERYMMGNPDGLIGHREVEILGFIIDDQNKMHECFSMKGEVGKGSSFTAVNQNEVTVIGSARNLPGLSAEMTARTKKLPIATCGIQAALLAARSYLQDIFQRAGSGVYKELGISPVFIGSLLQHAYFKMIGEQFTGERFSSDFGPNGGSAPIQFDYTFKREDGMLQLVDNIAEKKVTVEEAEHYSERADSELLDPQRLTERFDPTQFANTNGVIYVINQWVVGDNSVQRTIDKTNLCGTGKVCNPDYARLACGESEVPDSAEHRKYVRSGDHGLVVQPADQAAFEAGVIQHLFDHPWLSNHIVNYSDLYA